MGGQHNTRACPQTGMWLRLPSQLLFPGAPQAETLAPYPRAAQGTLPKSAKAPERKLGGR